MLSMSFMAKRLPLTIGQLRRIQSDVAKMTELAAEISRLMTAAYGDTDPKAMRAQEVSGALQRLQWAIDRSDVASP
jgi:hypothetical protein